MAKNWKEIRKSLSPDAEERMKARVAEESAKLPLAQLRRARAMTQVQLASVLHVDQGAILEMEKRSDMYLSTLRSYVEALGGHLEMRAIFPGGEIVLESLSEQAGPCLQSTDRAQAF